MNPSPAANTRATVANRIPGRAMWAFPLLLLILASAGFSDRARGQVVFVSDTGSDSIIAVSAGGSASTYATGVGIPEGLAFDSVGNLYVANASTGSVMKVAPGGGAASTFATGLGGAGGIAIDSSGNIFESNNGGSIYKITPGGIVSLFASGFTESYGLAFDSSGNLFMADIGADTIFKITPGGSVSTFATGFGSFPGTIAIDPAGDIFVSDTVSNAVYKLTPGGSVSTFASGLTHPRGLSFNTSLNLLYISVGYSGVNQVNLDFATLGGSVSSFTGPFTGANFTAQMYPVPEPATIVLLLLGAAPLGLIARLKARRRP